MSKTSRFVRGVAVVCIASIAMPYCAVLACAGEASVDKRVLFTELSSSERAALAAREADYPDGGMITAGDLDSADTGALYLLEAVAALALGVWYGYANHDAFF